jgi:hypothetical protein
MAKTHRTTPAKSDALSQPQLFGPPPIIEGEKAKDYRKLLERVFEAIGPADFIEEIWARDLADVTWFMFRLRRSGGRCHAVAKYPRANDRFQALWSKAKSDLNFDLMQARVITTNLSTIERIEALIASAQRRIDEVIRELDRHRLIRVQLNKFSAANEATKAAAPKMITGKVMDKKVA